MTLRAFFSLAVRHTVLFAPTNGEAVLCSYPFISTHRLFPPFLVNVYLMIDVFLCV